MTPNHNKLVTARRPWRRLLWAAALLWLSCCGCAAMTNPVGDAIPVRRLPRELLARPKDAELSIPLNLLGLPQPDTYRLAAGDVLGIWIDGVLGEKNMPIPVQYPAAAGQRLPGSAAAGYPVPVQEDGKITLPLIEPLRVEGLSLAEARRAIQKIYTDEKILVAGKDRILVSLMQTRRYQIVVMRQESPSFGLGPQGPLGIYSSGKRGTGFIVELPAYENDLLHALAQTGGLPALDDYNEVVIFRRGRNAQMPPGLLQQLEKLAPEAALAHFAQLGLQVLRIPLRTPAGHAPPLRPEDIALQSGDVVYLEARDKDVFYTGGLLPSGEHVLPRDRDLDAVQALCEVRGPLLNGTFNTNNLAGNLVQPGIGQPSANLLIVVRKTPDGGNLPIRIDLYQALKDPRENILLKPGDLLILQETPSYAFTRFVTQTLLSFNIAVPIQQRGFFTGALDFFAPNQLGYRAIFSNFQTGR